MNNLKKIIIVLAIFLLSSCGFKKLNTNKINNFKINKIEINGDKRLGYNLENNIIIYSQNDSTLQYDLTIEIKSSKTIKIRDAVGKTTRYTFKLLANIEINKLSSQQKINKTFERFHDYDVGTTHSETIKNEKNAIKNITNALSEDIVKYIKLLNFD